MARDRLEYNIKIIFKFVFGASGSGLYLMVGCSKDNTVVVSYTFHPITARAFSKHERVVRKPACNWAVRCDNLILYLFLLK